MELFCQKKVIEIIEMVKPRIILAEALSVLDKLLGTLGLSHRPVRVRQRFVASGRLYQSFSVDNSFTKGIIGISHLTGSIPRISGEEKAEIARLLKEDRSIFLN